MALKIQGMAPLLQVFDMPSSIRFYRDALGFKVISTSDSGDDFGWALLRWNGVELMLNTAYEDDERPSAPDPARVAAHDDTGYFSVVTTLTPRTGTCKSADSTSNNRSFATTA